MEKSDSKSEKDKTKKTEKGNVIKVMNYREQILKVLQFLGNSALVA